MLTIGIIGGTGVPDFEGLEGALHKHITSYGAALLRTYDVGRGADTRRIIFLSRHGLERNVPPHRINYRANIDALKHMGCTALLATAAAGSLRRDWNVGSLVLIDQFLDFTKGRTGTFFDQGLDQPIHVDMTEPYCADLRGLLQGTARSMAMDLIERGTYVCAEGPRFETAAEIRMMAQCGGDLVGMTQVPEVVLAREAEMCYATVAIVTNLAAGLSPSPLTHEEVLEVMQQKLPPLSKLLFTAAQRYAGTDCSCQRALEGYRRAGSL